MCNLKPEIGEFQLVLLQVDMVYLVHIDDVASADADKLQMGLIVLSLDALANEDFYCTERCQHLRLYAVGKVRQAIRPSC